MASPKPSKPSLGMGEARPPMSSQLRQEIAAIRRSTPSINEFRRRTSPRAIAAKVEIIAVICNWEGSRQNQQCHANFSRENLPLRTVLTLLVLGSNPTARHRPRPIRTGVIWSSWRGRPRPRSKNHEREKQPRIKSYTLPKEFTTRVEDAGTTSRSDLSETRNFSLSERRCLRRFHRMTWRCCA